ncbi:MAG: hypothetical protein V2A34_08065, partial [Lentisphaerota bacterium]
IDESSGVARNLQNDKLLWTHNDSGDEPRVFAFDVEGRTVGGYCIAGATAVDWEDMASAVVQGQHLLYLGDFGDNESQRPECIIYRVEEPLLDGKVMSEPGRLLLYDVVRFQYEDGPHNCEAMGVDPSTGFIYLATKDGRDSCGVFELAQTPGGDKDVITAKRIADLNLPRITAMDISPDGLRAIILTYKDAYLFRRSPAETWRDAFAKTPERVRLPERRQGESVCFSSDGKTLYLTSEQPPVPLWAVQLDEP